MKYLARKIPSVLACALVVVATSFGGAALAEDLPGVRIGVVDFQRLAQQSEYGKRARAKLEKEFKPKQERIQELQKDLEATAAKIKQQASLLSKDALQGKLESLREQEKEVARKYEDFQEEFSRRNAKMLEKLLVASDKAIKSIADQRGLEFVLENDPGAVAYASARANITEEVLAALNKNLP